MDFIYLPTFDHISKLDNLVNNFESMTFVKTSVSSDIYTKTSTKRYTNFSVSEILKPQFRGHVTGAFDSDSDGTNSVDSSELYSSGDEDERDNRLSQSPECNHNYEVMDSRLLLQYRLTHMRHVLKDEDCVSSDGSDCEAALDLRIQRKKTPPKITDTLPAWVYCTRYSDRPSAGPRVRRPRQKSSITSRRRNRTAFTSEQLHLLGLEFDLDPYLSETRRQRLANDLDISESSVKIWFQNQRAKSKKDSLPHPLAVRLAKDGLYSHTTVTIK